MRQMMDADGIPTDASPSENGDGDAPKAGYTEAFRPHARPKETTGSPSSAEAAENPRPERMSAPSRRIAYEEERRLVRRQKVIAGALGIFLGAFGAHKFYFGKTKWGILYAMFCWS